MSGGLRKPATDSLHPAGTHVEWSESFYFNFYDRRNDVGGFMRIGQKPNKGQRSVLFYLLMPDGTSMGTRKTEPMDDPGLRVGGLVFRRIVPDKEWALLYSGSLRHSLGARTERREVSVNLRYEALNEVFDYRECASEPGWDIATTSSSEHTEQFGHLTGEITIDGEALRVEALGERDHSWGVRDWTPPSTWMWLSGQSSERHAFNMTKLWVGHGAVDGGFIHVDGENRPIVKVLATTSYGPEGGPRSISLVLQEKGGLTHEVVADTLRDKVLPFSTEAEKHLSTLHTALMRFTMDGRTGYGFAEYLRRER